MNKKIFYLAIVLMCFFTSKNTYAQEEDKLDVEESAEVFLEEYTDEFQDNFFEALKQKGIENYDRAINLFLDCKSLDADNIVVDHELAKVYLLDKKFISAQKYAVEALVAEPENYWYLDTLVSVLEKQSNSIDAVESSIPFKDNTLQENLALLYYKKNKYRKASKILNGMSASDFKEELTLKINDATKQSKHTVTVTNVNQKKEDVTSASKSLELTLKSQIAREQYKIVELRAKDAVEAYPLQPYFYYAYGLSLQKNNKNKNAVEVLESSLDYLFNDIALANKIYKTLADAYKSLNNTPKANLYLSKIKPGF